MSEWSWVIASYALTWVVLGVYVVIIHGRLSRTRAELRHETDRADEPEEMQA
jgi:CcmD family protein